MKFSRVIAGLVLSVGFVGTASALTITGPNPINQPGTGSPVPTCTGSGTGNDPTFISTSCPAMASLTEYYKNDVPATESGSLAGSYASTVTGGNSGGTITWTGPSAVVCSATNPCWLLVKDGNQDPGRYAYNLTTLWNGTDTITLSGFWPDQGGISHWALYGSDTCVRDCRPRETPEPGTLALLGLGLMGLGLTRRKRAA